MTLNQPTESVFNQPEQPARLLASYAHTPPPEVPPKILPVALTEPDAQASMPAAIPTVPPEVLPIALTEPKPRGGFNALLTYLHQQAA